MKRINMTLDEVQAFVAVAQAASFKTAAELLHLSQPALSRRVDNLEQAMQVRLFERTTRRVSLTPAGHDFLVHAQAGLDALQTGAHQVVAEAARRATQITVACIPTLAIPVLPRVFAAYAAGQPELRLRILDEGSREVLRAVEAGEADFGLGLSGALRPDIDFEPILSEDYVLAMRRDHPLAGRVSISWRELLAEKMVAVAGESGNRSVIDHALSRLKRRPAVHFEANHIAGALGLVAAGLGVAAVPRLALDQQADSPLVGITLRQPRIARTIGLIVRRGRRLSPACQGLIQALRQELAGY